MHVQAEVVRLEEHLTVATRNHPHLVDLWISLRWEGSHAEWTKEFLIDAERHNAAASSAGAMHLVLIGERQGWIVARGVNPARIASSEVETLVRGMVAAVNTRITLTPDVTQTRRAQAGLSQRIRTSVASGAAGLVGLLVALRDQSADIASN